MNKKSDTKKNDTLVSDKYMCGDCGSKKIKTTWQSYKFPYGVGTNTIELSCEVPVRNCVDCGFSFMDGEAEDICHVAICKHLGVMPPEQIKALRGLYKLTQTQFCEVTKLGEATLSRWERGIVVQNNAYDNYLYLLGFIENIDRLQHRQKQNILTILPPLEKFQSSFREIEITEDLIRKQEEFELQPSRTVRG